MWVLRLLFLIPIITSAPQPQNSFPITAGEQQKIYDVIIVGAGLTGLSAARELRLRNSSLSVLLLEARGQVGGRIRADSMTTAEGTAWVDVGSQFISPKHEDLIDLANDLKLDLITQANCGTRSLFLSGRRMKREIDWSTSLQSRPTFDEVVLSSDAASLSSQGVDDFARANNLSSTDTDSINRLLQTLYDTPENEISALQVALTTSSDNSTVIEMLADIGHGQSLLLDGGMYQLVRTLADGLEIEYNQRVAAINNLDNTVTVQTSPGTTFLANQVIITTPPAVAATVQYTPTLEVGLNDFFSQYKPAGHAHYFTMTYETAFWRSIGKSGAIIYTSPNSTLRWLTTFDVSHNSQCYSMGGGGGILWGIAHFYSDDLSVQQRQQMYIDAVSQSLQSTVQPLDVSDVQFSIDPLALGSIAVMPPTQQTSFLQYFTGVQTHGNNVHFASAELSPVSLGLMNGAVRSGRQAAITVLQSLGTSVSSIPSQDDALTSNQLQRLLDAPLRDDPTVENTTAYIYSTSSHYPPEQAMAGTVTSSRMTRSSTPFVYHTSDHYSTTDPSATTQAPDDTMLLLRDQQNTNSFQYETSSHYPPTESIETTTYRHFSNGNLNDTDDVAVLLNNRQQDAAPNGYDTGSTSDDFVYQTSSINPPIDPIETTTYSHFSNGNSNINNDTPRTSLQFDSAPSSSPSTFEYRTSSQYPPTESVETTTYKHFSLGNADAKSTDLTLLHVAQDAPPSTGVAPPTGSAVQSTGNLADPSIVANLQQVAAQAPTTNSLSLARQISGILQQLLQSITGARA